MAAEMHSEYGHYGGLHVAATAAKDARPPSRPIEVRCGSGRGGVPNELVTRNAIGRKKMIAGTGHGLPNSLGFGPLANGLLASVY